MNFTDYQSKSRTTAKYPAIAHPVIYPTLGLTNEAGEVAGKIKKIFRDKGGVIGEAEREALDKLAEEAAAVGEEHATVRARLAEVEERRFIISRHLEAA